MKKLLEVVDDFLLLTDMDKNKNYPAIVLEHLGGKVSKALLL